MSSDGFHIVTGAFGFSGKYIAQRLLDAGCRVRTLTNSHRSQMEIWERERTEGADPFAGRVEVHPFNWDKPDALAESLRGAAVLYNTYWVRFNHKTFSHARAVENTRVLFDAAKKAGVGRIVHVSITNPSEDSPFEYFRGKGQLERALTESGVPYSILRPAVLFGREGILINNIAWMLCYLPVFGVFGDGAYKIQPLHVDDFAALAVVEGTQTGNRTVDAIGPETFTFRELVAEIGQRIGKRRPIVSIPPAFGLMASALLGLLVGDVVLTREEIAGLMAGLLFTESPPTGSTRLTDWVSANAPWLGKHYMSELARRR